MPFQSRAAVRANFMSLIHGKKSSPKSFLSRVRLLDDNANRNVSAQARHNKYREQLIDGIRIAELLELILSFSNWQTHQSEKRETAKIFWRVAWLEKNIQVLTRGKTNSRRKN